MVLSIVAQVGLIVQLNQTPLLVRKYKGADGQASRDELVRCITTFRLVCVLAASFICAALMLLGVFGPKFTLAGWLFIPCLFLGTVNAQWVFQAAERVSLQSWIAVLSPLLTCLSYVLFFRPGMSAASDLVVNCAVGTLMAIMFWIAQYRILGFSGYPVDFGLLRRGWEYAKESRWLFLAGVTCYTYVSLELPLVGWLRSIRELGEYRTAVNLVGAGAGFLAIIPTLLFPRFVEWRARGEDVLWRRQTSLARGAWVVTGIGAIVSFVLVPRLHPMIYGSEFAAAAWPCAILVVAKLIVLVNGIYAWGLWSDPRYDRTMALCMGLAAAFSLTSNLLLIPKLGMYAAAATNLGSELLILVSCYWSASRRRAKVTSELIG